jgi:hypothetical protein
MGGLHLGIDGALELKTGQIISWTCFKDDFWIYLWNPDTGHGERCVTLPAPGTFSLGLYPMEVWELKDGIVVFVLTLDLVVILDPETFQCIYAERSEFFSNDPNQLKDKKIHIESGARLHFRANRSPDWDFCYDSPFPFEAKEENICKFLLKLSDGRFLTINAKRRGYFSYMLIWNPTSGLPEAAFWGHDIYRDIEGAIELKDGRILSWSEDDTLRLWDPKITTSQEEVRLFDPYDTPYLIDIGKQLLVWSQSQHARNSRGPNPKSCTILNAYDGSYDGTVGQRCPEGKINLKDGRILSWRKNYLHLWSNNNRKVTATLKGHRDEIISAIEFNAGRLLSWDSEGEARFWRIDDGHCEAVISFQQNEKPPEGLKYLKNGNLFLTDCEYVFSRGSLLDLKDKSIKFCIFNTKTFKRKTTFQLPVHHLFRLKPKPNTWYGEKIQLLELKNGNILILLSTVENNSLLIILNPLTGSLKLISSIWAKSARRAIELNDGRIAFIQRGADELVIWEANQKKHSRLKSPDLHLKDAIKLQDGRIAAWSLEKILLISDKSCSRWDSETPFAKFQIANLKEFKDGTLIGWADINEREDGTGNAWDSIMNGRPFMRNSGLIFFFRDTNSVPHSINLEILSPSELSSSGIETLKRNISDIPKSIFEIFNLVNASNDSHVDTYQESGLCATFGGRVLRLQGLD